MPTATKSRSKEKRSPATEESHNEEIEQDISPVSPKAKKPLEIDEPEPVVGVDEKVEEDPLLGATEEDDTAEEMSLDGEELNPFGDRWEE